MLVRRCCTVSFELFDADVVMNVRARLHLLSKAATAAAHDCKRYEREWGAAVDALQSLSTALE